MLLFSQKFPRLLEAAEAIGCARTKVLDEKIEDPFFATARMIEYTVPLMPLLERAMRELRATKEELPESVKSMITPLAVVIAANMPSAAAAVLENIFKYLT